MEEKGFREAKKILADLAFSVFFSLSLSRSLSRSLALSPLSHFSSLCLSLSLNRSPTLLLSLQYFVTFSCSFQTTIIDGGEDEVILKVFDPTLF